MRLNVIAVGSKLPSWIETGINEYQKRLPVHSHFAINIIEAEKRSVSQNITAVTHKEGEKLLALCQNANKIIALDERGKSFNTKTLATNISNWQQNGMNCCLLIGSADGLSEHCKKRADEIWSLSPLTLPHGLARLLLVEQLYRAFSILDNHPYHRQ